VHVVRYDVAPVAFCLGVAAAASSSTPIFSVITSEADPDAQAFRDGVFGGLKYRTNGANTLEDTVPVGPDGLVSPETFRDSILKLSRRGGEAFKQCNHYIIATGRTTPSIMYALSSNETHGYVLGGWADFTRVRPARFVCCAVKHPGKALEFIFGERGTATLEGAALPPGSVPSGAPEIVVGLDQGAVGLTDLNLYSRYNPDGDDIAEAVGQVFKEIEAGEFDYRATIDEFAASHQPQAPAPAAETSQP
jgi:hypothetical protein